MGWELGDMSTPNVTIIDYGVGNLLSVQRGFEYFGASVELTSDPEKILSAQRVVLPGVGAFPKAMQALKSQNLVTVIQELSNKGTPLLAICLGMQLLTNSSEEGNVKGLGWINAKTVKFQLTDFPELKIPHMGWNDVNFPQTHFLCENYHEKPRFYFVHSYHVICDNDENKLMTTKHGIEFTSAIVKENIMGVQFHPEKSHKFGMTLFKNFIERC